ncbi:MAG: Gfo/Idh/MocA family oxidoreductase, partial [Candidatus Omnitrophota bacterium]
MKIVFFGLGSIGKRHAKILVKNFNHECYAFRSGKNVERNDLGLKEIYAWKEVEQVKPDAVFITNPTFMHIDTALKCAEFGSALFIEKPLDASNEKLSILLDKVRSKGLVSYVAYNLRFHPVIECLKEYLENKKVCHASVYNSSYLSDWRGGKNQINSYSAIKNQGGGVVLDLSHEFDYINYLFGRVQKINGVFDRVTNVTLDAEDFMDAVIKTDKTYVNLHLDFCSRHIERTVKIDCEDEYIFADLVSGKIEFCNEKRETKTKHFKIDR